MAELAAPGFGGLLRRLRAEAGLTQEELAEAASLSPRSVSDLERGINLTARKDTARLLADALGLAGPPRALFEAAARGRAPAAGVLAAVPGSLTIMPGNLPAQLSVFIGRDRELAAVRALVESSRLVTVTGPGGIGKTRLGLQVAAGLLDGTGDGVWLVELAPVADPGWWSAPWPPCWGSARSWDGPCSTPWPMPSATGHCWWSSIMPSTCSARRPSWPTP